MSEKISNNNKLPMPNKIKIITGLIFSILIVIIATLIIYPVVDTDTRFKEIKSIYDNDTFYMGGKCGFKGGYKSFIQYSDRQLLELDEFNIINPTYAIIQDIDSSEDTGNQMMQELSFIQFQRTGITSFKPIEEYGASVRNKTLAETIEIIKKYNLLKENPDPKNITVVPPKSPEELAKIAQQYCNQPEEEDYSDTPSINELPLEEIRASIIKLEDTKATLLQERETADSVRQEEIDEDISVIDLIIQAGVDAIAEQENTN